LGGPFLASDLIGLVVALRQPLAAILLKL